MNITITPGKAPFHAGLFFSAVRHQLGEPDFKVDAGYDGGNIWSYLLNSPERKKQLEAAVGFIQGWMKCFDLDYPESYCQIAKWRTGQDDPEYESLKIVIIFKPKN